MDENTGEVSTDYDYTRYHYPDYTSGITFLKYTGERQSLHLQNGKADIQMGKLRIDRQMKGRDVIVVDDFLTTLQEPESL